MSIEFFGVGGPPNVGGVKKSPKTDTAKSADSPKSDQVEFSSVLKGVNESNASQNADAAERAARVEDLKQQVASGSYQPDIQKVASSLLQFLVENK